MKTLLKFSLLSLLTMIMGCMLFVPKETLYLRSARDRSIQEDVRQRLGAPRAAISTADGKSLWIYHIYEIAPGGQDTWSTRGSWCDEYVLMFDKHGILRDWTHKSQVHGGELMPTYCVSDGFNPAS